MLKLKQIESHNITIIQSIKKGRNFFALDCH